MDQIPKSSGYREAPPRSLADHLQNILQDTDISPGSPAHDDISRVLASFGLDLVGWLFRNAANSHAARTAPKGGQMVCPALTLIFSRTADFEASGASAPNGNWDDDWALTRPIRDAVNGVLARHGLDDGYQSEQMFVFGRSWEHEAYWLLGASLKPTIAEIAASLLTRPDTGLPTTAKGRPPQVYFGSYWGSEPGIKGQFNLLFPDEEAMRRAVPAAARMRDLACAEMRQADTWGYCKDHRVDVALYYSGMAGLPPLYRED